MGCLHAVYVSTYPVRAVTGNDRAEQGGAQAQELLRHMPLRQHGCLLGLDDCASNKERKATAPHTLPNDREWWKQ